LSIDQEADEKDLKSDKSFDKFKRIAGHQSDQVKMLFYLKLKFKLISNFIDKDIKI
jgi:hypothetical protein